MGKKNKSGQDLGRSLIKDRFGGGGGRAKKFVGDKSMLHTTEIQDGYDWGRLNLQSVTEESSFQEFLSTAELAGTEFQAEKLNIKFVNPKSNVGLLTDAEKAVANSVHEKHKDLIKIPRRPPWNSQTTPEELKQNEKDKFLEWRRSLAQLQEEQGVILTPFEKNLEFWRQLWRVVERSDVVIQIVDARNPLLFRCEDLEKYVKEVSKEKINLILINKADFLTEHQRQTWANYFSKIGINIVFFSALLASSECETITEENDVENQAEESEDLLDSEGTSKSEESTLDELRISVKKLEHLVEDSAHKLDILNDKIQTILKTEDLEEFLNVTNSSKVLTCDELIQHFRSIHKGPKVTENVTTIGLVGYPNVGKSSTINSLMSEKKVSVSSTPGKTKHFQTLYLEKDILLCDCPGLVMPSFVYTKAEMIINGILPIDQMRDHVPPINLVSSLIPRHVLEDKYGFMLPLPMEGEDQERCPTAEELLNAYGYNRGYMTANGQPDNPRAARYILKDFVNGKLLYSHAPPEIDQNEFHTWPERRKPINSSRIVPPREIRAVKGSRISTEDIDKVFFRSQSQGVHVKGRIGIGTGRLVNV
ncbi:hypothetical protein ILUMI_25986 [Ignelater luminosus]|uniref:Large subunit GTPase 1 homolog n=1 Tax=Ignelater luminosus TaxID=2038154 RepID=A0A8K0FW21_IGNLU|nr:hypothetical protein ILUMI_25986 [Ignelater luminosus]